MAANKYMMEGRVKERMSYNVVQVFQIMGKNSMFDYFRSRYWAEAFEISSGGYWLILVS